jgi:hypothetical protein
MFKVLRAKIMNFGDALKKGLLWGACLGLVLSIFIVIFLHNETQDPIFLFVWGVVFVTALSSFLGCILALIILGIIGTLQLLNWLLCLLAGSLLSFLSISSSTWISGSISGWISGLIGDLLGWGVFISNGIGGMLGWGVSIALIPIPFLLRQYLPEKLPQWIDQSIDIAMVGVLSSIMGTVLTLIFEKFTGITLRGV